jgi:hypothetical protein
MAHGVLPLHHTTKQKHRRPVFYGRPTVWQRLSQLGSGRWSKRVFVALAVLLIVYRLSTHVSTSSVVPAQLKAATDHGRKVFNDAELRAAGITRFAAEAIPQLDDDEDEDDDEEAFPLPEYDLEPTQAAATSTEDVVAPTTVIKILDDDAPDEPSTAAVEKRWALEGADGSGLEALKAAILHMTEVCCAAFLYHVSDRLRTRPSSCFPRLLARIRAPPKSYSKARGWARSHSWWRPTFGPTWSSSSRPCTK